ncbi:uncharacterized protein LOC134686437 [Mytilus trossulus]|uniref:uncharacterized protein LOC134686437 n=1 Tax=Mytilus trossulus TaxID=6551 RepID=UPI003003CF10
MYINELPSEIILNIFSYLPQKDLINGAWHACILWQELSLSPRLWRNYNYAKDYKNFSYCYLHLAKINQHVRHIHIPLSALVACFTFPNIQWKNLESLHVNNRVSTYQYLETVVKKLGFLKHLFVVFEPNTDIRRHLNLLTQLSLVSLDIEWSGNQYVDSHLISLLRKQPNLKSLTLKGWHSLNDDTIARGLEKSQNIEELHLLTSQISNSIVSISVPLYSLTKIIVRSEIFDDSGLRLLANRASSLRLLDIRGCVQTTYRGLTYIARHCSLLKSVQFDKFLNEGNSGINSYISTLSECCHRLTQLQLIRLDTIFEDGLLNLFTSVKFLQSVTLENAEELSNTSLFFAAKHCMYLTDIYLKKCHMITAYGVIYLAKNCKRLKSLNVLYCNGIKDVYDDNKNSDSQSFDIPHTSTTICDTSTYFVPENDPMECDKSTMGMQDHDEEINESHNRLNVNDLNCENHSHLLKLDLTQCSNITTRTVLYLVKMCSDLRELNLDNCFRSIEHVQELKSKVFMSCTFLKNIHIYPFNIL